VVNRVISRPIVQIMSARREGQARRLKGREKQEEPTLLGKTMMILPYIALPSFRLNFCGGLKKLDGGNGQGWLQCNYGFLEGA